MIRTRISAHDAVPGCARFGRGGNRGPRDCVLVGSASARVVLRFGTFAVLVLVVGTFSVSKLLDMDVIYIGGEGARV